MGEAYANDRIRVSKDLGKLDYGKFLSALTINEFTAFRTNNLIKVIPFADARLSAVPVVESNKKYYEDEFVTDYIQLSKACSSKLLPVLRPMIPRPSHMGFNHPRSLIITDTYGNIQRIKKVIQKMEDGMDKQEECDLPNS